MNVWSPLLTGVEWIIRWLWCSKLPHRNGRIPAGCVVWFYWLQVSYQSSHRPAKAVMQRSTYCVFLLLEFRRSAWPFPHFSPMTFLSSAFVVWTIWAVRWTGCWGKTMFVLYWGNRQAALAMPMIYRLSWRPQALKSLSRQVTHKQRHARIAAHFWFIQTRFIYAMNMKRCTIIKRNAVHEVIFGLEHRMWVTKIRQSAIMRTVHKQCVELQTLHNLLFREKIMQESQENVIRLVTMRQCDFSTVTHWRIWHPEESVSLLFSIFLCIKAQF